MIATSHRPETVMPSRIPQTHALTGTATGTSTAAGKLGPELWSEWFPDTDPTLTIEDVVAAARQYGMDGAEDITIDKVRYWQREGVLPAPIRRKIGHGRGKARALYPSQAIGAVALVSSMQRNGTRLRQINALLARAIRELGQSPPGTQDDQLREALAAAAERQERRAGSPIRQVEVTFTDARDRKHSHVFVLDPKTDR